MKQISIVGYGKMAKAIACGLNGKFRLEILGRDENKIQAFIDENSLQNATTTKMQQRTINVKDKIIILCIKPYAFSTFIYEGEAQSVFSVMAGVCIDTIRSNLKAKAYCRVMPNIASLLQTGMSAIYAENSAIKNLALEIFSPLGECVCLDKESLINSAGAISGSGTAYLGVIAESLIDAGVREGLSLEDSTTLTKGLFKGFARLFEVKNADEIRKETTSPGGTTAEALYAMELGGIRSIMLTAVRNANEKAQKLS